MISFTIYESAEITDTMIHDIAALFSENYGIWGAAAQGRKQGQRVRSSPARLNSTAYLQHLLAIFLCKPGIPIFWSAMFLLLDGHSKALTYVGPLSFASARDIDTKG
ncbi:hypothetical protein KCU77_g9089, partial [Aureobasidium melanogenum]